MKKKILLSFSLTLAIGNAFAVCSSPILRDDAGYGSILTSARYNSELNTAFNRSNNLPGDCIIDGTVTAMKLAVGAITTSKIKDGAITAAKLAPGAIPPSGRLIRVKTFIASGTWTRGPDVGSVMVQVVGGGGASFYSGSTNGQPSSFGTLCVANGGLRPVSGGLTGSAGGGGGAASNGDINLSGSNGEIGYSDSGYGGISMIGQYGSGGMGSHDAPSGGGGAGGYCSRLIQRELLSATETVTVGAGGSNGGPGVVSAKNGIVIVYEYSL